MKKTSSTLWLRELFVGNILWYLVYHVRIETFPISLSPNPGVSYTIIFCLFNPNISSYNPPNKYPSHLFTFICQKIFNDMNFFKSASDILKFGVNSPFFCRSFACYTFNIFLCIETSHFRSMWTVRIKLFFRVWSVWLCWS